MYIYFYLHDFGEKWPLIHKVIHGWVSKYAYARLPWILLGKGSEALLIGTI